PVSKVEEVFCRVMAMNITGNKLEEAGKLARQSQLSPQQINLLRARITVSTTIPMWDILSGEHDPHRRIVNGALIKVLSECHKMKDMDGFSTEEKQQIGNLIEEIEGRFKVAAAKRSGQGTSSREA
ncbi:hypothetical protein H0H93_002765, partial [Arthromyces matolae]